MKNNTKIRLHLSKNLFETIAKEVLAEAKVNGGGAYTEMVKTPKAKKEKSSEVNELLGLGGSKSKYKVGQQVKVKGAKGDTEGRETLMYITKVVSTDPKMGSTYKAAESRGSLKPEKYEFHDDQVIDEMKKMEEMSSKEKMAKGLYKEEDMDEAIDFPDAHKYTYRLSDGNCIRINPETGERTKVHHTYCNDLKKEMQTNVSEGSNLTLNKYARDLYSLFKKAGATPEILTSASQKDMVRDPKAKSGNVLISTIGDSLYVTIKGPKETATKYSQLVSKQFPDLQLHGDIQVGQGWGGENDSYASLELRPKTTAKGDTAVREGAMEEGVDYTSLAVMLGTLLGVGGTIAGAIVKDLKNAKTPEEKKRVLQSISGQIGKQMGGNEPGDKEGEVKSGKFESTSLNELRKQIKNK